ARALAHLGRGHSFLLQAGSRALADAIRVLVIEQQLEMAEIVFTDLVAALRTLEDLAPDERHRHVIVDYVRREIEVDLIDARLQAAQLAGRRDRASRARELRDFITTTL